MNNLKEGFISPKKGYYYIVLNRKYKNGKRKPLWISTGLPAIKKNEAKTESKCLSARIQYSIDLKNGAAEKSIVQGNSDSDHSTNPLFADLLNEWLGYICVHPFGEIIDSDYITHRHRDLLKKAGLPPVRFHDFRHSCVGLMIANEVPIERIRDWIGHSDIRTTVNTYGHLEYHTKKKTAKIIEKSLPLKR